MAFTASGWTGALLLAAAGLLVISSVDAALINIINQCGQTITACATCCGGGTVNCYVLGAGGGFQQINVGGNWPGGVIWGFPGNSGDPGLGNSAKPQADLAEFTIGAGGTDFYDISNVDAYNLGMTISPIFIAGGGSASGLHCGSPTCIITDLNGFCQSPNSLTGYPGFGCRNTDGGGSGPTGGTTAFKNRCPDAYSYSTDNANVVYGCETGSNYQVVFCPGGQGMIREVVSDTAS